MYEVEEGRPVWKLRPIQLLLTLVGLIAVAVVAFMLAVSGPTRPGGRRRHRSRRGRADGLEHRALADRPDLRDLGGRRPVLRLPQRQATEVPVDQHRGRSGDPGLDPGIGRVRLLCRQLRQLQQDLRCAGRSHRLPALAVDHQPGTALRSRTGRRTRTRPPTAGRHPRRTRPATAAPRQPGRPEESGQRRTGRRTRPRLTRIPRSGRSDDWSWLSRSRA